MAQFRVWRNASAVAFRMLFTCEQKVQLSVMLDFESGGKQYRVARVLKRIGSASVRLAIVEDDGEHPVDGGAREIGAQIARIVGLDFDAFTKAVLLPQGKFDEFLRGES